jgi:hypothetical protein
MMSAVKANELAALGDLTVGTQPPLDLRLIMDPDAIAFRWEPQEDHDQGFETTGSLSRMFARYFAEQSLRGSDVVRLQAPMQPDWFAPLLRWDESPRALPLWRFVEQPNCGDASATYVITRVSHATATIPASC